MAGKLFREWGQKSRMEQIVTFCIYSHCAKIKILKTTLYIFSQYTELLFFLFLPFPNVINDNSSEETYLRSICIITIRSLLILSGTNLSYGDKGHYMEIIIIIFFLLISIMSHMDFFNIFMVVHTDLLYSV